MSAIVGIYSFGEPSGTIADDGGAMMRVLAQYPANDVRSWHDGPVFLGCHAQWITPESVHERLPYCDEHLKLVITADAIIDNRDELFERLLIETERRERMTDSELIARAYRKWGTESPKHLVGDFAFIVWDFRNRMLFGARDLSGNRTLYCHNDGRRAALCTTVSPLFALPGVKRELDEAWFAQFLAIPTMLDSSGIHSSPYRQIGQIPPAHSFTVTDGGIKLTQYGTLLPEEKLTLSSSGEYEEAFRDVFEQAVASKLRTYRIAAATLSGGLDSGAVAGFAAKRLAREGKTLHTYSYVPSPDFTDWTAASRLADETPHIQATVAHVGNISARYLDFPNRSPFTEVDEWLDILQAPYKNFENSQWIKGIYEEAAKQGAGVLLTGAGGNFSISWGPAVEYYVHLLRRLRFLRFYREMTLYGRRVGMSRLRLMRRVGKYALPLQTVRSTGGPEMSAMIHPDFAAKTRVYEMLGDADIGAESNLDMFNERETYYRNLAVLNMRGTSASQMSLRYALWERDPTGDSRVVRFCLSLPIEQYVQNGYGRSLVRRATKSLLPDAVRLNQRTRGVQSADWLHRMRSSWSALELELRRLCSDRDAAAYFNTAEIQRALGKFAGAPRPEQAFDPDARFLMRCLIAYRFVKQF